MQVWNVLHAAHWKYRTQKSRQKLPSGHHRTLLSGYIFATKARIDSRKQNLLSSNMSSRCPHNMVNFGPLAAEIGLPVWGTPANFNGFPVLAALLHGSQVVDVSKTLRNWTEGATYVRQGDHQVGHWPTFLVWNVLQFLAYFWLGGPMQAAWRNVLLIHLLILVLYTLLACLLGFALTAFFFTYFFTYLLPYLPFPFRIGPLLFPGWRS